MKANQGFGIEFPRLVVFLATLAGLSYVAIAVTNSLIPVEQNWFAVGTSPDFFNSLNAGSGPFVAQCWLVALSAIASTGFILGVGTELPAWFRWVRTLALAGFVISALNFILVASRSLRLAALYPELAPGAQDTLVAGGIGSLDPTGLFTFGLTGLWVVVLHLFAVRRRAWSTGTATLGLVGGILTVTAFFAVILKMEQLYALTVMIGIGIATPLWLFMVAWQVGKRGAVVAGAPKVAPTNATRKPVTHGDS